jgi:hypothetical protein
MSATAAFSSNVRYTMPTGGTSSPRNRDSLAERYLRRYWRWVGYVDDVADAIDDGRVRNVTAEDVAMFDAALLASVRIVHRGERR